MLNTTKIKFTDPEGGIVIKPWASNHSSNTKHLKDAKEAYKLALKSGCTLSIYK